MTWLLILYVALLITIVIVSYKCLGSNNNGLPTTILTSAIASFILCSFIASIYLAFFKKGEIILVKNESCKIDSIKIDEKTKHTVFYYASDKKTPDNIESINLDTTQESRIEFWSFKKYYGDLPFGCGKFYIPTNNNKISKKIYLNKSDYEIWKTRKNNPKK